MIHFRDEQALLFFGAPFGGDVAGDFRGAGNASGAIPDGRHRQVDVDEGAVLAAADRFVMFDALAASQPRQNARLLVMAILGNEHGDRTPDGFLRRIAEQALGARGSSR